MTVNDMLYNGKGVAIETVLLYHQLAFQFLRQEEPWKIASTQVFINGSTTPSFSQLPNIVLEEEPGEKVSLG